jgi:hypothetical protein
VIKRREFITLLGGAAAWPLVARAQQPERMRRIGVLMPYKENDPGAKGWLSGFTQGLQGLGWTDGRNVQVVVRWAASNDGMRMVAKDLVDLQPDVIFVTISWRARNFAVFSRGTDSRDYWGLVFCPNSRLLCLRLCPAIPTVFCRRATLPRPN